MSSLVLVECFPQLDKRSSDFLNYLSNIGTPIVHISQNRNIEKYGTPVWVIFPYTQNLYDEFMSIERFISAINYQGILVLANEEESLQVMGIVNKHSLKDKITVIFPEKTMSLGEDFFGVRLYDAKKTARMIGTIAKKYEEDEMEYHAR